MRRKVIEKDRCPNNASSLQHDSFALLSCGKVPNYQQYHCTVPGERETDLLQEHWLQLCPKMKKSAPKRRYKKMSSIEKNTGTVCRSTHNDGIKRQSLHYYRAN